MNKTQWRAVIQLLAMLGFVILLYLLNPVSVVR
jgi:hypothetical protein